jgi:hypothetical protein
MVGYSVITPFKRLAEFISYDDARKLVEDNIKSGDTVVEIYSGKIKPAHYTAEKFLAEMAETRRKYGQDCYD